MLNMVSVINMNLPADKLTCFLDENNFEPMASYVLEYI